MTIQVGDKVSWTHVSMSGRALSMSLREGTVIEINDDIATVKPVARSSRATQVDVRLLRLEGQKSQITEFIEAVREVHHGNTDN